MQRLRRNIGSERQIAMTYWPGGLMISLTPRAKNITIGIPYLTMPGILIK